jgi:hypothetical protein
MIMMMIMLTIKMISMGSIQMSEKLNGNDATLSKVLEITYYMSIFAIYVS